MSGAPRNISPGYPPLLWSSVEEAFQDINQNFNELYATIQADGSTQVVNFAALYDDVSPAVDDTYSLGSLDYRWKSIFSAGFDDIEGSVLNGLWAGNAHIKGIGSVIDLPDNSTVAGQLIIDPNKTFFKSVEIDNGNRIEADEFIDTLNLISGTAIQLSTDSAAESITIDNTGVTSLLSGSGISVSSATGNITVGNTGVLSVTNTSTLPSGRTPGAGIAVNTSTGNVTLTNTGILSVEGGFGITVNIDTSTGIANVVNTAPAQVAFRNILVDGQSTIVADSTADDLTFAEGYGIILTTDDAADTVTIAVDQTIDITGSVFANDSTLLVDGVDGIIVGPINSSGVLDGELIGSVFGDDSTLLVDGVDNKIRGNVDTGLVETNILTSQGGNLNATGQSLVVGAANGTSTGGDTIIGAGVGTSGSGGILNLGGGVGSAGAGGSLIATGGNGSTLGGTASFGGGLGNTGKGGDAYLVGGNSTGGGNGGDVYVSGGSGVASGTVFIGTAYSSEVVIENAAITGDITGSVFADNSTRLIDGTEGVIHAEYLQGTAQIDIKGSVFGDDSTVIIDGATSTVTGKIAPNGVTPASEFADGESGEIRVDDDYIWVKTPTTGAWKKVALTSFGS